MIENKFNADGQIIAGTRIDGVEIGMDQKDIIALLSDQLIVDELENLRVLSEGPWKVWVDKKTQRVIQISVGEGYEGAFMSTIMVGSTLREVSEVAGDIIDELDVYMLKKHPGICFELKEVEEWSELGTPIEFITIFPLPK